MSLLPIISRHALLIEKEKGNPQIYTNWLHASLFWLKLNKINHFFPSSSAEFHHAIRESEEKIYSISNKHGCTVCVWVRDLINLLHPPHSHARSHTYFRRLNSLKSTLTSLSSAFSAWAGWRRRRKWRSAKKLWIRVIYGLYRVMKLN